MKSTTITLAPLKGLRIGQYIWNVLALAGYWEAPDGNPLFFIKDKD